MTGVRRTLLAFYVNYSRLSLPPPKRLSPGTLRKPPGASVRGAVYRHRGLRRRALSRARFSIPRCFCSRPGLKPSPRLLP